MVKLSLANPSFVLKSPFCIDNLTELRNRIVDVKFMEQNVGYRIYNTRRTVTSDPCPILQTTTSAYSILLFTCLIYASKTAIVSTYITKLSKNTTVYTHAVVLVTYSPITDTFYYIHLPSNCVDNLCSVHYFCYRFFPHKSKDR